MCIKCGTVDTSQILTETFNHSNYNTCDTRLMEEKCDKFCLKTYDVLELLNIPPSIIHDTFFYFERLKKNNGNILKKDLHSYAILLACRKNGFEKSLYDIARVTDTPIKSLMRIENLSSEFLPQLSPDYNLSQLCLLYNIKYKDQLIIKREIKKT